MEYLKQKKGIKALSFGDQMKTLRTILEYGLIILLVILLRVYIITPIQVNGDSMMNTLHSNDIMLLNIISYKVKDLKRFDIIVFKHYQDPLIKRVIGLPGEFIEFKDNKLYVDGKYIPQPFLDEKTGNFSLLDFGYQEIPPAKYFVLGDNRNNSTDSRYIGFIDKKEIMGKANLIIFPFNRFGIVK